jgi:hypothetical protein
MVLNPDNSDNPAEPPILDISGSWVDVATNALDHLMPGDYPAIRTIFANASEVQMRGILVITDTAVKWVEIVWFDAS